jgi:hypothetical protein
MDDPYVAWRVEYDRKKAAERQENKRKFEAECLQEDRVTAAKRHKEDEQVKRHRKDKMVEFEPRITLTNALDLLGLSRETHPTMEDIYAGWTWRMVGLCATYSSSESEVKRITQARNALIHSTVKYLGLELNVPQMDHKQAAAFLEIPESADSGEIRRALERIVYGVMPPTNGLERYTREATIARAVAIMRNNLEG